MSETADRWRRLAAQLEQRVAAVPADRWEAASPCEGWSARDVVRHLVEWIPSLALGRSGLPMPDGPSVDEDPLGAWRSMSAAVQAALDDPEAAAREMDTPAGRVTVEGAVRDFALMDLVVHGWDLARATGGDESLDADEVARAVPGLATADDAMMRASGMFGPAVEVADDADDETRLLAFFGRRR